MIDTVITFAVGDRVTWEEGSGFHRYAEWGRVLHVSKSGALVDVQPDAAHRAVKSFRRNKYGAFSIRKQTPTERQQELWLLAEPKCKLAWANRGFTGRGLPEKLSVEHRTLSASEARTLAVELQALAAWLDARPK